jgi:hypothetical protein
MTNLKVFIAESVFPEDFYDGDREGHVVEAIVRLLRCKASYKIVLNAKMLRKAIGAASENDYDIFHLSCHGDENGIQLTDETELSWDELADCFQKARQTPEALVVSSCVGGDRGIARAFQDRERRPRVIVGTEGKRKHRITFPGACISWPILYTVLATRGITAKAFKDAVNTMNHVRSHLFVYRRWDGQKYRRYPRLE